MPFANHFAVILGLLLCFDQVFAINHFKEFAEGRFEFDTGVSYFKTTSNFTSSGSIRDLPSGNSYQLIDIYAGFRYGLSPDMSFYGFGNIGSASSSSFDANRSNSTLNKVGVGGDLLIEMASLDIIPEFNALFAIEKISEDQDAVMNNEGVNEFTGKLNFQTQLSRFRLFGYGGFTYRDQGRSNLLPWGINLELAGESMSFGGELFGFQTVTDDKDKGTPAEINRDVLRGTVNGGSDRFYSLNPSVVDSNVYLKTRFGQSGLFWAALGMTVLGTNYANGYHAEAGLRFVFGDTISRPRKRVISVPVDDGSRISTDKKVDRFEEDTNDGVDQRLFRPKPTPKPVEKIRPGSVSDQEIKNKMDDVEMQIELRSNKKKKRRR